MTVPKIPIFFILTFPPLLLTIICLLFALIVIKIDSELAGNIVFFSYFIAVIAAIGALIGKYIANKNVELIKIIQEIAEHRKIHDVKPSIVYEFSKLTDAINLTSLNLRDYHECLNRDNSQLRRKSSAIIYAAHDGIIGVDRNHRIRIWNNSAQRIFGYTTEDAINADLNDLLIPKYLREQHKAFIDKAFRRVDTSGQTTTTGRVLGKVDDADAQDKNGKPICISITVIFVDDMLVGFVQDVTEQRKVRAEQETYLNEVERLVQEKTEEINRLNETLVTMQYSTIALTNQLSSTKRQRLAEE